MFDLRFGFLVKNCIYDQRLTKNHGNPVKLRNKKKRFFKNNLNVGLKTCQHHSKIIVKRNQNVAKHNIAEPIKNSTVQDIFNNDKTVAKHSKTY